MYQNGVIVGRFYPFQKGHASVIQAALKQCQQVYVIVVKRGSQAVPAERRAEWIKRRFPDSRVTVIVFNQDQAGLPNYGPELWAEMVEQQIGCKPGAVFTSESYQQEYAAILGADLVLVDEERDKFPISATMIRQDPEKHRHFLEPYVYQDIVDIQFTDDT